MRDLSLFVGNPDDVVDAAFGPGLPRIRDWTQGEYAFPGYVTGFHPAELGDPDDVRRACGVRDGERLCLVTVGGSGVGGALLGRVLDAVPHVRAVAPDLRFLVVTGPRLDPDRLPAVDGVRVQGFLPELYRTLAACDVAVVQGGLTTCMELTALGKPFVYVPLRGHFEQAIHVRHRLQRYGAGRCLPYEEAAVPEQLAAAVLQELGRQVRYRPVETDGAERAAALLASLL